MWWPYWQNLRQSYWQFRMSSIHIVDCCKRLELWRLWACDGRMYICPKFLSLLVTGVRGTWPGMPKAPSVKMTYIKQYHFCGSSCSVISPFFGSFCLLLILVVTIKSCGGHFDCPLSLSYTYHWINRLWLSGSVFRGQLDCSEMPIDFHWRGFHLLPTCLNASLRLLLTIYDITAIHWMLTLTWWLNLQNGLLFI